MCKCVEVCHQCGGVKSFKIDCCHFCDVSSGFMRSCKCCETCGKKECECPKCCNKRCSNKTSILGTRCSDCLRTDYLNSGDAIEA